MKREKLFYDILIVGAGPAGLSAGIHIKQLCQTNGQDLSVCVLEKGAEVGSHILSGAVLDPSILQQLLPSHYTQAPLDQPVKQDYFYYLSSKRAWRLPTPPPMHNSRNYVISLGNLCRWLAEQAQALGVDIYPGFSGKEILYQDGHVSGVMTDDKGLDKNSQPTANYQPGIILEARYTLLAEGCRGSLSEQIIQKFQLRNQNQSQTYALGLKELWQVQSSQYNPGTVIHTVGWPLDSKTYGGSFIYHLANNKVALGLVIGLDYTNPWLNTFQTFQQFKTHPFIAKLLQGGQRLSYGARALNEGGYQSIPQLTFPGGVLLGCAAGFINVPKLKGIHHAMHSGMLAAKAIVTHFDNQVDAFTEYQSTVHDTIGQDLYRVRNIRPAFHWGLWAGLAYAACDTYVFRGRGFWTWRHKMDDTTLTLAKNNPKINYPVADNQLSFDLSSSLYLSNISHHENQPCHLHLENPDLAISYNYAHYAAPEQRYCPAGVYEILTDTTNKPYLQINAQNCIHCKACDIKDPQQNIQWLPPEGGNGPNYTEM